MCAVDFSLSSSAALQVAADLARQSGARLTAVCVEDPLFGTGATAAGYDTRLLRASTLKQLKRLVERVTRPVGLTSGGCQSEVIVGKAAPSIVRFVNAIHADLIVMGTSGRSGTARLFFGSTARAVLKRAEVPVLVVPRSRPQRKAPSLRGRPVVGALDLGARDLVTARRVAHASDCLDGVLTLLHVVPDSSRDGGPRAVSGVLRREALAIRRLERIASNVGAAACVTAGAPADEIPRVAADMNAGAIVLALQRSHGLLGRRQGTITYGILCRSTIPVLALPPAPRR